MPRSTATQRDGHEVDAPVFDGALLRRERELSARWTPDWHNARRFDPPARPAATNHELGLVTVTLSVEEIDAVIDRLDGSIGCADPVVCDVVAMLVGARAQTTKPATVPPAAWGVR